MNICLCNMTKPLLRQFFQGFTNDPAVFDNISQFRPFVYSEAEADDYWKRQKELGRIHLAIMLDNEPIGEIILKHIDPDAHNCTLSIHLKNDSVKNCGYGTYAEILTLEYAFETLGMEIVFADALIKNLRSRHVLEKVGFREIRSDSRSCYYICHKV